MGNCASSDAQPLGDGASVTEKEEYERRSRALDKELRDMERRLASQIKILLLGAGESGKTTVLKVRRSVSTSMSIGQQADVAFHPNTANESHPCDWLYRRRNRNISTPTIHESLGWHEVLSRSDARIRLEAIK